jgi:hypothetical protein
LRVTLKVFKIEYKFFVLFSNISFYSSINVPIVLAIVIVVVGGESDGVFVVVVVSIDDHAIVAHIVIAIVIIVHIHVDIKSPFFHNLGSYKG